MRSRVAIIGAIVVVASAGVLVYLQARPSDSPTLLQADEMLPSVTAEDWVTYGDHLVLFTVTGESRGEFVPDEQGSGQGMAERLITTSVDAVLWSRPEAVSFPEELDLSWGGWRVEADGRERAFRYGPSVALDVGVTYVGMMTYVELPGERPFWAFLSTAALLPAQDGIVGEGDVLAITGDGASTYGPDPEGTGYDVLDAVWGAPVNDLVALLERTPPDPEASEFMNEPAVERYADTLSSADG